MKKNNKIRFSIGAVIFLALILRLAVIPFGTHSDLHVFSVWAKYATDFNLRGYYNWLNFFGENPPIQPPVTIYVLALANYLHKICFYLLSQVNFAIPLFPSKIIIWLDANGLGVSIKLLHTLCDLGIGYLIYKIALSQKVSQKKSLLAACLYLFNPLTIYNSAVWGQNDALVNLFFIGSIYALFTKKDFFVIPLFAIACLTKASLFIFAPIFLIWLLKSKPQIKTIIFSLCFSLLLIYGLARPFAIKAVPVWLYELFTQRILLGEIHDITANAFNFWALFFGYLPVKDTMLITPWLTAQTLGNIFMGIFTILISISLYKKFDHQKVLMAAILLTLASFLFMTRMHERYLFPIFAPLAILVATGGLNLTRFVSLSAVHLFNLYHLWWYPKIPLIINIFSFTPLLDIFIIYLYFIFFTFLYDFWKGKKIYRYRI